MLLGSKVVGVSLHKAREAIPYRFPEISLWSFLRVSEQFTEQLVRCRV